ncbi:porin family protein [Vibrio sp. ZSDE26]|uniref:Porin family protein n=1 Tax=Vibrio amylolyticus TaxID=2847292 RepID=A0A9X1XGT7_9VIBR|nr:porin family protein [Vibrio amylolyticus]MCK6262531.1 porin family protein [Vibrio amylolyticus]
MKITLTPLLVASLISAPVLANTLEGHRVGLGFSKTQTEDVFLNYDYDANGLKLEYGYDFNNIVGLNVSYNKNNGDYGYIAEYDATTFKIDADIGYAFHLTDFIIKPYGVIGFASYKEEDSFFQGDWKDSSLFLGMGARAYFGKHFYSDLRFDFINLKEAGDDMFIDQFSITVGYKF